MQTAQLVPVSQWVYDLYKVTFWNSDPDAGGTVIHSIHIAASSEGHMESAAWENAPRRTEYMTWEIVKENVGRPQVVGSMYGIDVYEGSLSHGRRLEEKL
jgi:hypothetical protein